LWRRCGARADAEVVRGWRGGRVLVAKGPLGFEITLLVTTWASAERAGAVEAIIQRCIAHAGSPDAPRDEHLTRSGERLIFLSGVRGDVTKMMEDALATVGTPPPPAPPLGAITLAPPPVPLGRRMDLHGAVVGDTYTSDWLGVRARVPRGFRSNTKLPLVQLMVVGGAGDVGGFMIEGAHTKQAAEQMHGAMAIGMQSTAGGGSGQLDRMSGAEVRTRLGAGTVVEWRLVFDAGVRRVRTVVVRACNGYAAYAWVQTWSGSQGAPALDAWLDSFEPTGSGTTPACRQIVEEATIDLP
jgi:hypothetical protein